MTKSQDDTGVISFGLVEDGGSVGQVYTKSGSGYNEAGWEDSTGGSSDHGGLTGLSDDDHEQYTYEVFCATHLNSPVIDIGAPYFGLEGIFPALQYISAGRKILLTNQTAASINGVYEVPDDWFGGGGSTSASIPVDYLTAEWAGRGIRITTVTTEFSRGTLTWLPLSNDGIEFYFGPVIDQNYIFPVVAWWAENVDVGSYISALAPGWLHYLNGQDTPSENGWYVEAYTGNLIKDEGLTIAVSTSLGHGFWASHLNGVSQFPKYLWIKNLSDGLYRQIYPPSSTTPSTYISSGNHDVSISDSGRVIEMADSSAASVTILTNASTAIDLGTTFQVYAAGTGTYTIQGAAGVTVRNAGNIASQFGTVSLRKRAENEWVLSGDVV